METKGCSKQTHQHKLIYTSYQTPLPPYNVKKGHLTIFNKMLFGRSCFQLPRSVEGQKHYLPLLYSLELPGCPMHLFLDFWYFFFGIFYSQFCGLRRDFYGEKPGKTRLARCTFLVLNCVFFCIHCFLSKPLSCERVSAMK